MKYLSSLRYLLFLLFIATASACGNKDDEPQLVSHQVQVRYVFEGHSSLGAYISGGSVLPDGTKPENTFEDDPVGSSAPRIKDVGAVKSNREFTTTISFEHVRGSSRTYAGNYFTAEILVDNVVRKTLRIDHTTDPGPTYATARATILSTEW